MFLSIVNITSFNLNREAAPLATLPPCHIHHLPCSFNLNREAAPLATLRIIWVALPGRIGFNLNREAAPLATRVNLLFPPPELRFNLNREAAPLATTSSSLLPPCKNMFQSQPRSRSISDIVLSRLLFGH